MHKSMRPDVMHSEMLKYLAYVTVKSHGKYGKKENVKSGFKERQRRIQESMGQSV